MIEALALTRMVALGGTHVGNTGTVIEPSSRIGAPISEIETLFDARTARPKDERFCRLLAKKTDYFRDTGI